MWSGEKCMYTHRFKKSAAWWVKNYCHWSENLFNPFITTVCVCIYIYIYIFIYRCRTVHLSGKYLVCALHSTADWVCCWDRQVVTGVLSYHQFVLSGMLPLNILACNKNYSSWFSSYHGWKACISQLFQRSLCHRYHHCISDEDISPVWLADWLARAMLNCSVFQLSSLTFEVHHPYV